MNNTQHTALPWGWRDGLELAVGPESDPEGNPIAVLTGHAGQACANAALIVRAVNNHAALVEALESVSDYWAKMDEMRPQDNHGTIGAQTRAVVRAALAAARE